MTLSWLRSNFNVSNSLTPENVLWVICVTLLSCKSNLFSLCKRLKTLSGICLMPQWANPKISREFKPLHISPEMEPIGHSFKRRTFRLLKDSKAPGSSTSTPALNNQSKRRLFSPNHMSPEMVTSSVPVRSNSNKFGRVKKVPGSIAWRGFLSRKSALQVGRAGKSPETGDCCFEDFNASCEEQQKGKYNNWRGSFPPGPILVIMFLSTKI